MTDRDADIDRERPEEALPGWLEMMDHTADAGMVVRAPDLPVLFARAAWGMFSLITDPATIRIRTRETVTVEAPDREALLVRWLSELNFRHITRRVVYGQFDVTLLTDTKLTAAVGGESIEAGRHPIYTEIKAVTFHGLTLGRRGDAWEARVIFDL